MVNLPTLAAGGLQAGVTLNGGLAQSHQAIVDYICRYVYIYIYIYMSIHTFAYMYSYSYENLMQNQIIILVVSTAPKSLMRLPDATQTRSMHWPFRIAKASSYAGAMINHIVLI